MKRILLFCTVLLLAAGCGEWSESESARLYGSWKPVYVENGDIVGALDESGGIAVTFSADDPDYTEDLYQISYRFPFLSFFNQAGEKWFSARVSGECKQADPIHYMVKDGKIFFEMPENMIAKEAGQAESRALKDIQYDEGHDLVFFGDDSIKIDYVTYKRM
ncbi:MAG: hypothetical protein IJL68_05020 [Bacteroidales bacterium]|jgi:hypothetical protein|nr:hypothetical protein [Bacteroidales bacterium]MBQ7162584.1 hypothetical protein [Bacteroidales bacterium]